MHVLPTNYNFKNLTNQVFERLTVVEFAGQDKNKCSRWLCKCSCGKELVCHGNNLVRGKTKSCGCLNVDLGKKKNLKHGMFGTRFYGIWAGVIKRCTNPKDKAYSVYGGRGIKFQSDWSEFTNFKRDMYDSYLSHVKSHGERETTIERNDTDGNYCLENCSWATWKEQQNNRRNSRRITA